MSRPGGPYREEPGRPQHRQQQPAQQYPPQAFQQEHGRQYQPPHQQRPQQQRPQQQRPQQPRPQQPPPERDGGGFRLPGLGLLLSLLGLVVQVLCFTVLPWVYSSNGDASVALPEVWEIAKTFGDDGFGDSYVLLFSYPLAVLGILLSLVAVIESALMKVVWAGLTIIGIGVLLLWFGLWQLAEVPVSGKSLDLSRKELTIALVALAALVVVIFMLKTAMSTFRRIAGLVLLVVAGVHVYAVSDMTDGFGFEDVRFGAYGPAVGYVLAAAAAFVGPRRVA